MAQMANWNGHTFEVSPKLIRGFTDMKIKGSCETTDKNSENQKYVERKYGEIPKLTMNVHLNAMTGVTDVFSEAMAYVQEATDGACAYFYLGDSKLLPAKLMLTSAEIEEIVHMPAKGNVWISCTVKLEFKQGSKNDGSSGSSSSSSSSSSSASSSGSQKTTKQTFSPDEVDIVSMAAPKAVINNAKKASQDSKSNTAGMAAVKKEIAIVNKQTKTTTNSATKVSPTTGRSSGTGLTNNSANKRSISVVALD